MNKLLFILLIIHPVKPGGDYPLKDGKPTSKGIEQYVEEERDSILAEYQDFIGDTLYDIFIYAEDLTYYDVHDSMELGRYYPNEIFITTQELFIAYEVADLTPEMRAVTVESNAFVKSTMIHELTHDYLYQIGLEMRINDSIQVDRAYRTNLWLIRNTETFGSSFIEEGLCEYMAGKMGEIISPRIPYIPATIEELTDRDNRYAAKYKYSSYFLKQFIDSTGFKTGAKILLSNPPPTFEEILNPDLYFERLINPFQERVL